MSPRGSIHHIDLSVRDPQASKAFYKDVLSFMGYRIAKETEDPNAADTNVEFDLPAPQGVYHVSIGLVRARADSPPHHKRNIGLHHLAFRAASREDVESLHSHLQKIGANILDAPAEYPQYSEGYYAVFFTDPDGIKLEFVFKP